MPTRAAALLLAVGGVAVSAATARASTFWVAVTGDDAASCAAAQSPGTPRKTINAALACLGTGEGAGAGHMVVVKPGTYPEWIDNVLPGGTSWSAPFTLRAETPRTVLIKPPPGAGFVFNIRRATSKYAVIEGLVLDGTDVEHDVVKITRSDSAGAAHHIRIVNSEIRNAALAKIPADPSRPYGQGIHVSAFDEDGAESCCNEFIDLDVHHNGASDFDHGFYICASSNLVQGCRIHHNYGYGGKFECGTSEPVHMVNNNVLRNNVIHDNSRVGTRGGWVAGDGTGNKLYNNVVYGNRLGLLAWANGKSTAIYHNTIFNNNRGDARNCIKVSEHNNVGTLVKNNLCFGHNGQDLALAPSSQTEAANNLCKGHASCVVGGDPFFVSYRADGSGDYHLRPGSPAIDRGVALSEVAADLDGVPRPPGAKPDLGAYELGPRVSATPASPRNLRIE